MKVLLAVDGSPESDVAVRTVAGQKWQEGTVVRALSVALGAPIVGGVEGLSADLYAQLEETRDAEARRIAESAAAELRRAGLQAEAVVRRGDARHAIVEEAGDWGCDLVVLGSHGRKGIKRLFAGSTAEYVVRHAPCSVEVARSPWTAKLGGTRDVASLFAPPPRRHREGATR